MRALLSLLLTALLTTAALAQPGGPFPLGGGEPRAHDPSTLLKRGGGYWVFFTGAGVGFATSTNLTHWTQGEPVFREFPAWHQELVPGNRGHLWAPDVVQVSNRLYLYYSVSTFGKNHSAIGLATRPATGTNSAWTDAGPVVVTTREDDHNAIDPSVLLDRDGRLWMAYGSFWSGLKLVELNPATGLRVATNSPVFALAQKKEIEAAGLYRRGDYYYLFVNWGNCCRGTNSTYEIRVGRSRHVTGPYVDREGTPLLGGGGTPVLATQGRRIGPGHAAILRDGDQEYLSYHFYDADRRGRPTLQVVRLGWTDEGWPAPALAE